MALCLAREIITVLSKVLKTRINLKDIDEKTRQLEEFVVLLLIQ